MRRIYVVPMRWMVIYGYEVELIRNVMTYRCASIWQLRGNRRMEWVTQPSRDGVITKPSTSRLTWHPRRLEWTGPLNWKTKSSLCAWATTFRTCYTRRGLNLSCTKLPRPWSPWESSPSRKNPDGRAGNQTRDLMISSQKLWPLDHKAGHWDKFLSCSCFSPVIMLPVLRIYLYQWCCVITKPIERPNQSYWPHPSRMLNKYTCTGSLDMSALSFVTSCRFACQVNTPHSAARQ
jgi:hypothetical protein